MRLVLAADLSTRLLSVHLEQSYRHFDGDGLVSLPSPGLPGLRTDTPFATMRLDTFREARDQTVRHLGDPPAAPRDSTATVGSDAGIRLCPRRPVQPSSAPPKAVWDALALLALMRTSRRC